MVKTIIPLIEKNHNFGHKYWDYYILWQDWKKNQDMSFLKTISPSPTAIWSQGLHQTAAWIMFQDGTESRIPAGRPLTFEQRSEQTLWSSRRAIEVLAALTLLPRWLYTSLELSVIWRLWQSSTTGPPQGLINVASQGTCHRTDNRERHTLYALPKCAQMAVIDHNTSLSLYIL